ncbi:organomercurial lyase [Streptoalloteichus hindustanus]|uniref:Alkylmercury lyase n=1 Tax=Streptoalloteichus hindustanus TaxID=2017 RepID=A0A1M5MY23_STRHI|nr:organomercurial lyase [Streptoalloteichus hindustanus]SHG82171.1 Alkylmercury lyase [Streptoalloteichus hindustanus]
MDTEQVEDVRLVVYRAFASDGAPPSRVDLARRTGLAPTEVDEALRRLHEHRDLVLGPDGQIVMAHPFSAVPLGFSVMGRRTLWWGGCAWDSFAIPHLLPEEDEVLVATRCPGCGAPHAVVVRRDAPPESDLVAHFLTPVDRVWDDVVRACGNQRIFCAETCVTNWLERTRSDRGCVMDLPQLWRLARGWYAGRLDRGYQRREPSAAAEYFHEVGLRGPFWGLPRA